MKGHVVVRVHDRMADLEVAVDLIRRRWTRHEYAVTVVSNGLGAGHVVPTSVRARAETVELEENAGHLGGSSSLLAEAVRRLREDADFAVLLEADTWLLDDRLVDRYARRLRERGAVWAAARWLERYHSVALDFAVVDPAFLRLHPDLARFERHPETRIASRLRRLGAPSLLVRELMPVHVPSAMRRLHPRHGGRFRAFPGGPMVTHHVEDLPGGIEEKKRIANYTAGYAEFDVPMDKDPARERRRLVRLRLLARIMPRSAWVRRRRDRPE